MIPLESGMLAQTVVPTPRSSAPATDPATNRGRNGISRRRICVTNRTQGSEVKLDLVLLEPIRSRAVSVDAIGTDPSSLAPKAAVLLQRLEQPPCQPDGRDREKQREREEEQHDRCSCPRVVSRVCRDVDRWTHRI